MASQLRLCCVFPSETGSQSDATLTSGPNKHGMLCWDQTTQFYFAQIWASGMTIEPCGVTKSKNGDVGIWDEKSSMSEILYLLAQFGDSYRCSLTVLLKA